MCGHTEYSVDKTSIAVIKSEAWSYLNSTLCQFIQCSFQKCWRVATRLHSWLLSYCQPLDHSFIQGGIKKTCQQCSLVSQEEKTIEINVSDAVGQTIKPSPGRECKRSLGPSRAQRPQRFSQQSLCCSPPFSLGFGLSMDPWKTSNTSIKRTEDPISILHTAAFCRRGQALLRLLSRCFQV